MTFLRLRSSKKSPSQRELEALVRTLVDRCEPAVWERVHSRVMRMGPAEARGYIRARSADIVHDQVGRALEEYPDWQASVRQIVADAALSGIVRQTHRRLLNARNPIVEYRRAA